MDNKLGNKRKPSRCSARFGLANQQQGFRRMYGLPTALFVSGNVATTVFRDVIRSGDDMRRGLA
jgi:hypothetical protein